MSRSGCTRFVFTDSEINGKYERTHEIAIEDRWLGAINVDTPTPYASIDVRFISLIRPS